jgi:dTDP-4-amino-4,6-dideoxygalactose transaminase
MQVPFINFKRLNDKYLSSFQEVLKQMQKDAWYILGSNVENFENQYAKFSNVKHCVGVANGLDALILSLKVLGIKKNDEIIVPSNTYIATWLAITHLGAVIVPVEPKESTGNINPDKIEEAITKNTKVVMVVNLYGQSAELHKINLICKKNNLYLIEDNAQSQGSSCRGQKTGSFGIVNATSFYPGKNIGALGDAGAITTNDINIANKLRTLRNYGSNIKYYNDEIGYNSRLDELQAGFLSIKLKDLDQSNENRQQSANYYNTQLQVINEIAIPELALDCSSVYHIYQIRIEKRDELKNFLSEKGVSTMIHYPIPPHLQNAYKSLGYKKGDFPIAEKLAETTLSLPMDPNILNDEIDFVCDTIKKFYSKSR